MTTTPQLDRYLGRLKLQALGETDHATLVKLHRAHLENVPFENLDIGAGVPIVLDESAILEKIVDRHRGGFCYELNGCFAWLLRRLGFSAELLSANVMGKDGTWGIEFDHALVAVQLDELYIADVGFGDHFLQPLMLTENILQTDSTGEYRFENRIDWWILHRRDPGGEFAAQYRFIRKPHVLADFEPGSRFHQSPASHFSNGDLCTRATPVGRLTLRRDRLITRVDGQRSEAPIESDIQFQRALWDHFGIRL